MHLFRGNTSVRVTAFNLAALGISFWMGVSFIRPNLLWLTVHYLCKGDVRLNGQPFPCLRFNQQGGFAILTVPGSKTHLLLVPTRRVTGIEDPSLRGSSSEYWSDAWNASTFISDRLGRRPSRDVLGLAVNSRYGRTQNQLHIHIDCINPVVYKDIRVIEPLIGLNWTKLPFHIFHHTYLARKIYGVDLNDQNPIDDLIAGQPSAATIMPEETLAVLGETFADGSPGFILLSSRAQQQAGYSGFSEEVLDHKCQIMSGR